MPYLLVIFISIISLLSITLTDPVTAQSPNCTLGIDLATPASVSSIQCMITNYNIQFAVIRAFQSNCWLDPHAVQTIQSAWEAGLAGVDVYLFPSVGCTLDARSQIGVTLDHLAENNASFNTLWLDIENWSWGAAGECEENLAVITDLMEYATERLGVGRVGIYTTMTQWHNIACNTASFSSYPLWWARWNHTLSFEGFTSFGGWQLPTMKQYEDFGVMCGVNVDADWRESGECGSGSSHTKPTPTKPQLQSPPVRPSNAPSSSSSSNCTIGVDLATPVSVSAFQCLISTRSVQFLTVRAFQSNCYIDPHTAATIEAAWQAGIQNVDIYFFPSYGCTMSATQQFDAMFTHLSSNENVAFNRIFLDVESWAWDAEIECEANLAWFTQLFDHIVSVMGISRVGIYTGAHQWSQIMCDSTAFNTSELWYPHWDRKPDYNDFKSFGGWQQPSVKQFTGNDQACDIHLDFDYREDGMC